MTRKKRTVDWPHEIAPGNFSSLDYDKLDLPNFVGGFLSGPSRKRDALLHKLAGFLGDWWCFAVVSSWPASQGVFLESQEAQATGQGFL